jgi:hypothetical protein
MIENKEDKYSNDEERPNEECGFAFSSFVKIVDEDTGEVIMTLRAN